MSLPTAGLGYLLLAGIPPGRPLVVPQCSDRLSRMTTAEEPNPSP
jgi:hypothetical protein